MVCDKNHDKDIIYFFPCHFQLKVPEEGQEVVALGELAVAPGVEALGEPAVVPEVEALEEPAVVPVVAEAEEEVAVLEVREYSKSV